MKKSYNRYLAFDPLFALVWCRRLSNDTKNCARWLYCEITNWKDWAKNDFVSNNKGRTGLKKYILWSMLIQKNKYVLPWNYILPIYGICKGKCKTQFLPVEPSQHISLLPEPDIFFIHVVFFPVKLHYPQYLWQFGWRFKACYARCLEWRLGMPALNWAEEFLTSDRCHLKHKT